MVTDMIQGDGDDRRAARSAGQELPGLGCWGGRHITRDMRGTGATCLVVAVLTAHLVAQSTLPATMHVGARSLEDFRLPPKSVFDRAMPRYPNVWFFVDVSLASSYDAAVKLVTNGLRETMRLREDFGPFDNPEGCDFETRLEHLQPWLDRAAPVLQHAHAFHMRYYYSALARQSLGRVELRTADGGARLFYRFAASVHYEVEHFNPNHADVESCPVCGRTGAYGDLTGNLVEVVHDPLGLELLMKGTIRGEVVRFDDQSQQPVGSVLGLRGVELQSFVFPGMTADRNTLRVGIVVITAKTP
jgi:hypothetical protein